MWCKQTTQPSGFELFYYLYIFTILFTFYALPVICVVSFVACIVLVCRRWGDDPDAAVAAAVARRVAERAATAGDVDATVALRRAEARARAAANEAENAAAAMARIAVGEAEDAALCRVCLDAAISPQTPRLRCAHVVCEACTARILCEPERSCVCPFCREPLRAPVAAAEADDEAQGAAESEEVELAPLAAAAAVVAAAVEAGASSIIGAAAAVAAPRLSDEELLRAQIEARLRARRAAASAASPVFAGQLVDLDFATLLERGGEKKYQRASMMIAPAGRAALLLLLRECSLGGAAALPHHDNRGLVAECGHVRKPARPASWANLATMWLK